MTSEATQEADKKPADSSYADYFKFADSMIQTAVNEVKLLSIDRHQIQIAHIRQSLYLPVSIATAVCAVAAQTPAFNKNPLFSSAGPFPVFLLGLAFLSCVVAFFYGIFALRGEKGGRVPLIWTIRDRAQPNQLCAKNFSEIVGMGFGVDSSFKSNEAKNEFLGRLDEMVSIQSDLIRRKGKKVRCLNAMILTAAGLAALGTLWLFSTSFYGYYYGRTNESAAAAVSAYTAPGATAAGGQNQPEHCRECHDGYF